MTTYSTRQMIEATSASLRSLDEEIAALEREQRAIGHDTDKLDGEIDAAWQSLSETLLPALDPASLDRAAALLRHPPLSATATEARRKKELLTLEQRLAEKTADPLFLEREPRENEIHIRLAEIEDALRPLQASTETLEAEPMWFELLEHRYGTPEYAVPWYSLRYYRHWKYGDIIVERHGARLGCADFQCIAAKYVDEKAAQQQLAADRRSLLERQKAIRDLVDEVDRLERARATLDDRLLARARTTVREILAPLPDRDLHALFGGHADLELAWKRISGLRAQQGYLRALIDESVRPFLADLHRLRAKIARDAQKLARPKNAGRTWSAADHERRVAADRRGKWRKRRERIHQTHEHIVHFHHYDRYDPTADLLWWDTISDGVLDGSFLPDVRARGPRHVVHTVHDGDPSSSGFRDVS